MAPLSPDFEIFFYHHLLKCTTFNLINIQCYTKNILLHTKINSLEARVGPIFNSFLNCLTVWPSSSDQGRTSAQLRASSCLPSCVKNLSVFHGYGICFRGKFASETRMQTIRDLKFCMFLIYLTKSLYTLANKSSVKYFALYFKLLNTDWYSAVSFSQSFDQTSLTARPNSRRHLT